MMTTPTDLGGEAEKLGRVRAKEEGHDHAVKRDLHLFCFRSNIPGEKHNRRCFGFGSVRFGSSGNKRETRASISARRTIKGVRRINQT